jgi:hypothetical protein
VPRVEVSKSVNTVKPDFHVRLKKYIILVYCVFFKPYTKLRLTVITALDASKRSTQKALSCSDAILVSGPAAPQ